jgi:hypothetical protein
MTLILQPVQIATGFEDEGMLVFDRDQRLLAVLTHLSEDNEVAPGHWFLEAGFGLVGGVAHPSFVDLDAAQDKIEAWPFKSVIGCQGLPCSSEPSGSSCA